jgi:hypothetical protein
MKLEDFVKSLKVGEHLRLEATGENCRVARLWRAPVTGGYCFASGDESYGDFETPEELLKCLKTNWLEYDYEIYKTRVELKSEVKQLEKALIRACEIIEDGEICSECPATNSCLENSDITCAKIIFDCLMKEAAK